MKKRTIQIGSPCHLLRLNFLIEGKHFEVKLDG